MAGTKVIHVDWEPRKVILDVEQLKALEELAYRRILDLIYVHGNRLIDDDAELERMTKTGRKWLAIKKRLIEVHEKLYVSDDGYLRNDKCDEKCAEIERYIAQKSGAGKASAEKRKSKKNNDVGSTGGGTETPTEEIREGQRQTNQPYHPSIGKKEASPIVPPAEIPPDDDLALVPLSLDRSDEGEAVRLWNDLALRRGLPPVQKTTDARRRKLRARLKDCGGLEGWKAALEKIEATPGLLGANDRKWRANIDFLLSEGPFTRLMEGAYDHWGQGAGQEGQTLDDAFADMDAMVMEGQA